MTTRALVLGSGGVTGVAWEAGVLSGLQESGADPSAWDVVIGSSAGAFVGAWFASGRVAALRETQLTADPARAERELKAATGTALFDALRLGTRPGLGWVPTAWATTASLAAMRRYAVARGPAALPNVGASLRSRRAGRTLGPDDVARIGDLVLLGHADERPGWIGYIERELGPVRDWPAPLVVTALHLASGARGAFSARSGTPLAHAVAASTAVPLVVGPVTIDGHRYGDGGTGSPTNADLAAGFDEVLVVAPVDRGALAGEVAGLRAAGSHVVVVRPGASAALLGRGVTTLDVRRRPACAAAGYVEGVRLGSALAER
jgi:NTE family protein